MENYNYNPAPVQNGSQPGSGFAIASLVLGILGVLFICLYGIGLIPSVLAIIFAVIAKKKGYAGGLGTGALIVAIAGAVLNLIMGLIMIFVMGTAMVTYIDRANSASKSVSLHNSAVLDSSERGSVWDD
ncbi:hypothetical protein SAMN02910456_02072 [Ruminococcaceae bacterium YRB3002]|nr:hypothetical protein SAMN02910456_02072 [Ruminococcaceae bacterium YRB3002]